MKRGVGGGRGPEERSGSGWGGVKSALLYVCLCPIAAWIEKQDWTTLTVLAARLQFSIFCKDCWHQLDRD